MRKLFLLPILLMLAPLAQAADTQDIPQDIQGERVFIVHEYRYEPGEKGGDPDTGHALCGTRCNALSVDYRNFIEPGGWRFIKVAGNLEVILPLDNPFLSGQCICTADEYVVKVNDFNQYKPSVGN